MNLPSFLIIGAQKCGTSSLYSILIHHDSIRSGRDPETGACIKEINFFSTEWARGVDWYAGYFPKDSAVYLDATANYLCHLQSHPRMRAVVPNAKLIVTLRDPVARAFSQHNHYCQMLPETKGWDWQFPGESFAKNVRAEYELDRNGYYGLLKRGCYISQLEHLLQYFPREQIKILVLEQWQQQVEQTCDEVLDFLGLPSQQLPDLIKHQRSYDGNTLDPEIANELARFYRPYNEKLFDFLGDSIDQWMTADD